MNKVAFLAGYLHKEAGPVDWLRDKASGALGDLAKPLMSKIKNGTTSMISGMAKPVMAEAGKMFDSKMGELKEYGTGIEKKMEGGMKAHAAATSAATIGTGLLNNMSAGSRHKEMLQAIKGIGKQPINKPAAQRAFRLNRPVPGTAGRAR